MDGWIICCGDPKREQLTTKNILTLFSLKKDFTHTSPQIFCRWLMLIRAGPCLKRGNSSVNIFC